MAAFLDVCRFNPVSNGTGSFVVSSAVTGYQTPASAGAVNGKTYRYRAESADLSQWEVGYGVYTVSTTTLTRATILFNSSGGTSAISFTAAPQVSIVALAEDVSAMVATVTKQVFTSTGTYTPSAGMLYCIIECVGGGGGGGGANNASTSQYYAGAGGGSGGYSRLLATAATIGVSKAVTIGAAGAGGAAGSNSGSAGGDTSVGTLCIAKGGSGGTFGSNAQVPNPGAGGVAGTGDLTAAGGAGGFGVYSLVASPLPASGFGGNSYFGGGAPAITTSFASAVNGAAAGQYGSGGSGGIVNNSVASAAGGNGSAGVVFITEYCGPV